jgi:hypothetical protein
MIAVGDMLNGGVIGSLSFAAIFSLPILIALLLGAILGRLVGWALRCLIERI